MLIEKFQRKHAIAFAVLIILFIVGWGIWSFIWVPVAGSDAIQAPPAPVANPPTP